MELHGKKALVTGGALRVGRAICLALARAGCDVAVHYRRSRRPAGNLIAAIRRSGCRAAALQADLRQPGDCRRLVAAAYKALDGLDILVNNAAVFERAPLTRTAYNALEAVMQVNLMAPVMLTRHFSALSAGGKVVNILDRRISSADSPGMAYCLSKGALADFTRRAALELAPLFTVNAVAPGAVLAPVKRAQREAAGIIPLQRRPALEDVTDALLYLLRADAVTGQVLFVDGGQHLP